MSPQAHVQHRAILIASFVVTAALAGCVDITASQESQVHEIEFWVEEIDWELHPGVTKTVWAFCAEGSGVEHVHDVDPELPCSVPGPTIRVTEGDLVRVTFRNTHTIPHTVHFHGMHPFSADMNGNPLLGDAHVADAGETETIEWIADPAGTFIYHCHFATPTHMDMGMYGTFIVEPRDQDEDDKPDVEHVMVLDEWKARTPNGDLPDSASNIPDYNVFTINGKSFPLTQPILTDVGDEVRVHMVNAGYEFHAMHLHGYTPLSYEGVAGPEHAVITDVREIAPGQAVVLDLVAEEAGVWLFHDHVVPRVTALSDGSTFGPYPRGMLTVFVVGQAYQEALGQLAPQLAEMAAGDAKGSGDALHGDQAASSGGADAGSGDDVVVVDMVDLAFDEETLEIEPGTTVRWVNKDPFAHTATAVDGSFDSGQVGPDGVFEWTFEEEGTYDYYCVPHASQDPDTGEWRGMTGSVVVTA